MPQTTASDPHHKRQRSPTPSGSTRRQPDIDELTPDVADLIANSYFDYDDADGRDSYSNGLNANETNDNETDDENTGESDGDSAENVEELDVGTIQRTRQPRANAFNGFKDPAHEIVLLKALDVVRPFGAQHGQTATAWLRVVRYLKDHDDKERAAGRPTVFNDVNPRVCQARWKTLSREYADFEDDMVIASGVNPHITDRLKHIQPVYEFEKSCKKASNENKDKRQRKKARTESNRVDGEHLLERSRTGLRQRPPGSIGLIPGSIESTPSSTEAQDSPHLSQGFFSGTESESAVSTYTPRTPAMRKRAMATMLTGQMQDAVSFLKTQMEMVAEDREERRKDDEKRKKIKEEQRKEEEARRKIKEERRKEEEDLRRKQAEDHQRALMELVKTQTESMERIAQQQSASTERIILALMQGINKKE
ncbi:hypothetical protein BGZ93_002909 [Podila epicladia]|nr:hypothetical protein BGZ92_004732 [Podila epicladia]KAG0080639.1 hypothetical protein BGZ93_002909 [Podila epicladia]